ncbi:hypothetical protein BDZ97DRAFT_2075982 [Flammula alnicola]|nr:hypothetical protein BDZ97DRAFT_2075982 [Flammula alnicola]
MILQSVHSLEESRAAETPLGEKQINNLHDPLVHVPVEIASEIFTWCHEETYRPSVFGNSPKSDQGSPLRLAAVCKTWREIAFKSPQLWTSLYIMHNPAQTAPFHLELVAQWLGRSSNMPIRLRLQYASTYEGIRREKDEHITSLAALIRACAPRWNALNLIIPFSVYADFIRNLEGAPSLEYLRLDPMNDGVRHYLPNFDLVKTPCLRSLAVSRVSIRNFHIEWDNLTSIQMDRLGIDEMLEVLSRASRVVDCKMSDLLEDLSIFDLPTPFLVHRSLRDLRLHPGNAANDADLCVLYDRLVLPSLQHFSYDSAGYTIPLDLHGLLSLFTRSRSPITHLSLAIPHSDFFYNLFHDHNTIIQILENLPSITHLSLAPMNQDAASKVITDRFLQRMASFSSMQHDTPPTNVFLPYLESFRYEGSWPEGMFSWGCVADIFHDPAEDNRTVKSSNIVEEIQTFLPAIRYHNRRPSLLYFHMTFYPDVWIMSKPIELDEDLRRLIGIRSAGVKLHILEKRSFGETDLIESAASRKY